MNKPKHYNFHTNEGMHSAMQDYAKSFDKPSLIAKVVFTDGSEMLEEFDLLEWINNKEQKSKYRVVFNGSSYSVLPWVSKSY